MHIINKEVLLRDRKRRTTCSVACPEGGRGLSHLWGAPWSCLRVPNPRQDQRQDLREDQGYPQTGPEAGPETGPGVPSCEQTNKLKRLPYCHTSYVGSNYHIACFRVFMWPLGLVDLGLLNLHSHKIKYTASHKFPESVFVLLELIFHPVTGTITCPLHVVTILGLTTGRRYYVSEEAILQNNFKSQSWL